jgi:hypothetical protein
LPSNTKGDELLVAAMDVANGVGFRHNFFLKALKLFDKLS